VKVQTIDRKPGAEALAQTLDFDHADPVMEPVTA
jgi:hypothetical protein